MRKTTIVLAAAAGIAAIGAAAPVMASDSGVNAGDLSLVNVDASDAAHWQICGQNILAQPGGQGCDNEDGADGAGVDSGALSLFNADASDAAHWQICGQNVGAQLPGQMCGNN